MPRRLRVEFDGAIDHVVARGDARQKIVRDDADRRRLIDGLERTVVRHSWDNPRLLTTRGGRGNLPLVAAFAPVFFVPALPTQPRLAGK
jgi:hypothetical protein